MSCPYCTNGIVLVLLNAADFHCGGDEPIIEERACEECGSQQAEPAGVTPW